MLTVGETDHFAESGGMINFVQEGNKIRFQINREEATKRRVEDQFQAPDLAFADPEV